MQTLLEILVHVCTHTARPVKINHNQVQTPDLVCIRGKFPPRPPVDKPSRGLQGPSQGLKESAVIWACIQGPVLGGQFLLVDPCLVTILILLLQSSWPQLGWNISFMTGAIPFQCPWVHPSSESTEVGMRFFKFVQIRNIRRVIFAANIRVRARAVTIPPCQNYPVYCPHSWVS